MVVVVSSIFLNNTVGHNKELYCNPKVIVRPYCGRYPYTGIQLVDFEFPAEFWADRDDQIKLNRL
jgi:hypothetical protein